MTRLSALRQAMTAFLQEQGVDAMVCWPKQNSTRRSAPVAVVGLQSLTADSPGFQNYLGECRDSETGVWTEQYGQRVKAEFAITLYSPEACGDVACMTLLEQIADALQAGSPNGLTVSGFSLGKSGFDANSRMFHAAMTVSAHALLVTTTQSGAFLDFEVKGGLGS